MSGKKPLVHLSMAAGRILAWATILVAPLLVLPVLKDAFRLPKLVGSETLALGSLLLLAVGLFQVGPLRLRSLWRLPALQVAAPIALVTLLGLATSSHPEHVRDALASLFIGLGCLVGWSLGLGPKRERRMLDALLLPAILLGILAILQFHDLYRPFRFQEGQEEVRVGITSLAGSVADLGAYLVLPVLVAQIGLWRSLRRAGARPEPKKRKGRAPRSPSSKGWMMPAAWAVGFGICLYTLFITQTVTALLAFAVSSLLLWWFLLERKSHFLGALAVLVVVGAITFSVTPLAERARAMVVDLSSGNLNEVLTGRLDGWRTGLLMLRENPVTGVGHGAFRTEFVPAKLSLVDRGIPFFGKQRTVVFANAHNEPIEVLAEWGIPGFVVLLWAGWVIFSQAWRIGEAVERQEVPREDRALAWSGLAALVVLSVAFFPFRVALTAYPSVLFLSWMLARRVDFASHLEPAESENGVRGRLLAAAVVPVLLVSLVLQGRRATHQLRASAALRHAEEVTARMVRSRKPIRPWLQANLEILEEARLLDPTEVGIPIAVASQYLIMGRAREAVEWYDLSLELEPRPEAYLNRGKAQLQLGEIEEARRSFELAVKLDQHLAREVPPEAKLSRGTADRTSRPADRSS